MAMELRFYKKTEKTESGDEICTYYVLGNKVSTFIMMNAEEPVRYIISCLPGTVDISEEMKKITQSEFLVAATKSNNAACWYIDNIIQQ